jgi:hypothetical protein
MAIVKMTRKEIVAKIDKLWSAHEDAVSRRLEVRDREVLDKLAKFLNMPRHVRTALDWSYTRAMIGSGDLGQTPEAFARESAYNMASSYVRYCLSAMTTRSVYDYSEDRRMLARCEGACAGYLFAAKERVGS